jgi:RNA polymerase sigma factor (sigma-70 family)
MSETDLLNKIKNNPFEFSEVFKLYYKPIFGYILRRTGNFDDTADIAAETFLKTCTHINRFSYKGISIKVWLYRIATNEVNLYFRRNQKHSSVFERIDFGNKNLFDNYLEEDRKNLEAELLKHDQFNKILKVLKTLPEKYQEVISLKYFEGKENKEIAEIPDIKEGTIKSLLSRGIDKLRKSATRFDI